MKRQLKTLKGKRVVLTNNANEIGHNEIGIIEKQDGTLEVKEHNTEGKLENIAGSGGSSSDNKDGGQWYKTYFKAFNPKTGKEQVEYIPLLVDTQNLSMIFDRSVAIITEDGGSGNGYAAFYGDIPFDLSYRPKILYGNFLFMFSIGLRLNKYNYDIIDYESGVPMAYLCTQSQYEYDIDCIISEWSKNYERKYSDKHLQYLHIIMILSVIYLESMQNDLKEAYNNHRYISAFEVMDKLKNVPNSTEMITMYNDCLFIEPAAKEELLQIAKERVENYINKH
jgi:hypothetical protein